MVGINEKIKEIGIVPVIKLNNPERDAAALARALCKGDVPIAEVTFRAKGAEIGISLMKKECPEMLVGAGTVLSVAQVEKAISAGAEFIVSPGFDEEIVSYCKQRNIPVYPGCTTATDYHSAYRYGLEVIKFFPAEQSGGLAKIKALSAPFPMFRVMPTGGIVMDNLKEYIASETVCACGCSFLAKPELIEDGRWEEITELCKKTREIIKEART